MSTVTHPSPAVSTAWRQYRVGKPGSVLPSDPIPEHLASSDEAYAARDWANSPYPRTLLVTGADALARRAVAFCALEARLLDPEWRGYWTAHDYCRNLDQLDNAMKLARVTSGSDDVLREAYTYELAVHSLESSHWLFLDMLSEASLTASRAFDLFHLLLTRASSSKFFTVVSAAAANAAVANHDASKALHALFSDVTLVHKIEV